MTYLADPVSMEWDFWKSWRDGDWEPKTHAVIQMLVDGGTFVDIGAWVGPTTIWAAETAGRVVAVEPDMTAMAMLDANTKHLQVDLVPLAIHDHDGEVHMAQAGNSMSRSGDPKDPLVPCVTIESLFATHQITDVDLIKIDIEGAEATVLPQAAEFLNQVAAPIHLSTHPWSPLSHNPLVVGYEWSALRLGDDEWLLVP